MTDSKLQEALFKEAVPVYDDAPISLSDVNAGPLDVEVPNALVESIRRYGLQVPVIVAPAKKGGGYDLVDGRRRIGALWQLHEEAQKADPDHVTLVPARIMERPGAASSMMAAAITLETNLRRTTNPLSELKAIERLMSRGADAQEVAHALGLPIQTIKERLSLQRLSPALRKGLEDGKVAPTVAKAAAKLPPARQEKLSKVLKDSGKVKGTDLQDEKRVTREALVAQLPDLAIGTYSITWQDRALAAIKTLVEVCPPTLAPDLDALEARIREAADQ